MEICTDFHSAITNGIRNILEVINGKLLRNYINNLVAVRYIGFILIRYLLIYFRLCYLIIRIMAHNIPTSLEALNMMTSYTYIHITKPQVGIGSKTIIQ